MVPVTVLPYQILKRFLTGSYDKMFTFLICLAVAAAAAASHYPYHQEPYAYPRYTFEYAVHDPHTKDIKKQRETRDGDRVQGSYSLLEPDGTWRIVDYQADSHNGFTAVVRRQGHAHHPQVSYHGKGFGGYGGQGSYVPVYVGYYG